MRVNTKKLFGSWPSILIGSAIILILGLGMAWLSIPPSDSTDSPMDHPIDHETSLPLPAQTSVDPTEGHTPANAEPTRQTAFIEPIDIPHPGDTDQSIAPSNAENEDSAMETEPDTPVATTTTSEPPTPAESKSFSLTELQQLADSYETGSVNAPTSTDDTPLVTETEQNTQPQTPIDTTNTDAQLPTIESLLMDTANVSAPDEPQRTDSNHSTIQNNAKSLEKTDTPQSSGLILQVEPAQAPLVDEPKHTQSTPSSSVNTVAEIPNNTTPKRHQINDSDSILSIEADHLRAYLNHNPQLKYTIQVFSGKTHRFLSQGKKELQSLDMLFPNQAFYLYQKDDDYLIVSQGYDTYQKAKQQHRRFIADIGDSGPYIRYIHRVKSDLDMP